MKTSIYISGQINGNFKLRNAIITADCEEKKGMFNSIELVYPTKKEAVKALSDAYQSFVRDGERKGIGGITYSRGYSLGYDASTAKIIED
jgi:hypothetical protein